MTPDTATLKARVALGMAELDRVVPGWEYRMNLETLDVGSPSKCVACQASGSWSFTRSLARIFAGAPFAVLAVGEWSATESRAIALGFMLASDEIDFGDDYRSLTSCWKAAICDRLMGEKGAGTPCKA